MEKELLKTYRDEINFLLELKKSMGPLNNRIHNKLALLAIEEFKQKPHLRDFTYEYKGAGASGIDIEAFNKNKKRVLLAEVKTILPDKKGIIRRPQKKYIMDDLERLMKENNIKYKFFITLSPEVKKWIKEKKKYHFIKVVNLLEKN